MNTHSFSNRNNILSRVIFRALASAPYGHHTQHSAPDAHRFRSLWAQEHIRNTYNPKFPESIAKVPIAPGPPFSAGCGRCRNGCS